MKSLKSPITGSSNVLQVRSLDVDYIINGYKKYLDVDVSRFFKNKELNLYKCLDTGYRFYYPFEVSGDSNFYKELQKIDWYYQDWKYEYEVTSRIIQKGSRVLEIGCGKGVFLNYLKDKDIDAVGLELNDDVSENLQYPGITVINETIEQHALINAEIYDCVISFQVLEHISDVKKFIEASLKVLKKNGKMLIAVPNNDTFFFSHYYSLIRYFDDHQRTLLMNMPPHHMGLWNSASLKKISGIFDIQLDEIYKEPLAHYRVAMTSEIIAQKIFNNANLKMQYMAERGIFKVIRRVKQYLSGDTIIAVYTKK